MKFKNIQDIGFTQGVIRESKKPLDYLLPLLKKVFSFLHIASYDDCCNDGIKTTLPTSYNKDTENLTYYNPATKTWDVINTGGGGGGSFDATVEFSVNINPNTVGTVFIPDTPALDTVIYVSTIDGSQWTYYGGTYHTYISPFWSINGNNTVTSTNFLGSINNQPLKFRTNNVERAVISAIGQLSTVDNIIVKGAKVGSGNETTSVVLGNGALNSTIGANANVAIGYQAMAGATNTIGSVAIGYRALSNTVTGQNNTSIGSNSSLFLTSGDRNNMFGAGTANALTTGTYNNFFGNRAGGGIISGSFNLILGNIEGLPNNLNNNIIIADGQGNVRFKDDNINTILPRLAGSGLRMVIANTNGELSTQTIPSGVIVNFADEETPSGTIDGINNIFTILNTPIINSTKLYVRGQRLKKGIDYTQSGTTITIINSSYIPAIGDDIIIDYRY